MACSSVAVRNLGKEDRKEVFLQLLNAFCGLGWKGSASFNFPAVGKDIFH